MFPVGVLYYKGTQSLWQYTLSLIHGDGVNGSSVINDSKTLTTWIPLNAVLTTADKYFGSSSINLGGPNSIHQSGFNPQIFRLRDFSFEAFVKITVFVPSVYPRCIFSTRYPANNSLAFVYDSNGKLGFMLKDGSGTETTYYTSSNVDVQDGLWHHVYMGRQGTTWYIGMDGVIIHTQSNLTHDIISSEIDIGTYDYTYNDYKQLHGLIDEIRILDGYAAYTTSYSIPSQPFPNS